MLVDVRFRLLNDFRYYIESMLYPVLVVAESPYTLTQTVSSQLKTRSELIAENEQLSTEIYLQSVNMMRLHVLEQENAAMRRLLNSPVHVSLRRMFAEVIDVDSDPYIQRIVINQGAKDGVYQDMPVGTDEGLVGQVGTVNYNSSRVLLLSDPSSSVPIINTRSEVRAIASGTGVPNELSVDNLPRSTDIREGDLLVTSGIGGIFPEGYPVAIVTSVGYSDDQPFAEVKARTLVDVDKIRHVLLFWYQPNVVTKVQLTKPKEQTDGKYKLRDAYIKQLIEAADVSLNPKAELEAAAKAAAEAAAEDAADTTTEAAATAPQAKVDGASLVGAEVAYG